MECVRIGRLDQQVLRRHQDFERIAIYFHHIDLNFLLLEKVVEASFRLQGVEPDRTASLDNRKPGFRSIGIIEVILAIARGLRSLLESDVCVLKEHKDEERPKPWETESIDCDGVATGGWGLLEMQGRAIQSLAPLRRHWRHSLSPSFRTRNQEGAFHPNVRTRHVARLTRKKLTQNTSHLAMVGTCHEMRSAVQG